MTEQDASKLFTRQTLDELFPPTKADDFFDALYGDASEGAYDIRLEFNRMEKDRLMFEFHLLQRPGKCLACNLTYGLPEVFSRHPIINLNGLAKMIDERLGNRADCTGWEIGHTREVNRMHHLVPVSFTLKQ